MRGLAQARWLAGAAVLALTVSACGGDGDDDPSGTPTGGTSEEPAATGGTLRTNIGEPAFLVPANSNESEGTEILSTLFSPLVDYNKDGSLYPVVASELPTSDDNINWTINIADGWTFTDGTPVTAASFVDAWNFAAYGPNAMANGYFFGPGIADVVGYADLQSEDPDGEEGPQTAPPPAATEMSGLAVVSDTQFTVELTAPLSFFPLMLGYTAFYPMAEACLTADDFCNEKPIGNGPFMLDNWTHQQSIDVSANPDWNFEPKPNLDGIEFNIYSDSGTGYLDLQDGNLDFLAGVPGEEITNAKADFPDTYIEEASSTFQYIGYSLYDETFGGGTYEDNYGGPDKVGIRKALSMAIDRQTIIDTIFASTLSPADSLISPVVDGYREGACGDACVYDVDAAKALWDESGGAEIAAAGPITMYYNFSDSVDHSAWLEAIGNYWQSAFGLTYELKEYPTFGEYLADQENHLFTNGVWRLGWSFDYPSPQSYLSPIYGPGAGEGNFGYSNPDVDALLQEGNSAPTIEEGIALYQQAEDKIFETFPNIPLWFSTTQDAYNDNVQNAELDLFGRLDYVKVSMTDAS
jgi:ABC-type oligopeptide transport system substrate-binding subunit